MAGRESSEEGAQGKEATVNNDNVETGLTSPVSRTAAWVDRDWGRSLAGEVLY